MLRFIKVYLFLSTMVLLSAPNIIDKVFVKKDKIHFVFNQAFNENDIHQFVLDNPKRTIYDFKNTKFRNLSLLLKNVKGLRMAQYKKDVVRIAVSVKNHQSSGYQPVFFENEYYITMAGKSKKSDEKKETSGFSLAFFNDDSKNNVHKSELIVIDAGHGGHDSGAVASNKREKDVVLQIAKRVENALKKRGHPVYMTRKSDRFLKLRERTKFADKKDAVVFVSIHANSVPRSKRHRIHGIETYFLQKTRDAKSQRIAARENKSVLKGTTKLSRNVIIDSVLNGPKIVESNKLAISVQRAMISKLQKKYSGVKDNGVKHAPFWVLVGASRPSILVEVGYISYAKERKQLFNAKYQAVLAEGIANGIDSYLKHRKKEIDFH
jgi:N-acetylmuramoyl-L-alanine amidase